MPWESDLITASLDGIEFPLRRRRAGGGNDFARASYQNVPGQDVEQTGIGARHFEIMAELFEDVDPSLYPGRYRQLHDLVQNKDKRGEVEYVDPVFGPINVIIARWESDEDADKRNGATMVFTLEERSAEPVQFLDLRFLAPRGFARDLASELDAGLPSGIALQDVQTAFADIGWPLSADESASFPGLFLKLTDDMFDSFDSAALALDDIAFEVDRYRYRVDRLLAFDPIKSAENWSIFAAAVQLSATVTKVASAVGLNDTGDSRPQLVQFEVPAEMSAGDISHFLYGDYSKSARIEQLNPTPNPLFYQPGQILTVDAVTF
jgi:prophage DNA circulation protein